MITSSSALTLRTSDPALHHPASTGAAQAATKHGIRDALRACDPHLIATLGRLPRTRSDRLCSAIGSAGTSARPDSSHDSNRDLRSAFQSRQ